MQRYKLSLSNPNNCGEKVCVSTDFYSFCVYAELRRALKGLVEKR